MPRLHSDSRAHLVSAVEACPDIHRLKPILARAIAAGLWRDPFLSARVVAFSAATSLPFAQLAFDASDRPSAFSYASLIRAHSAGPTPSRSLLLFRRMLRAGLYPDRFAFPFLLRAAARADPSSSATGGALHALALRHGLSRDPHVGTSLLHVYASWGLDDSARRVFDEMPDRTTVTWNAIISCCARTTRRQEDGLSLLGEMLSCGAHVNADTLAGALSCCAGAGALAHGRAVHGLAARRGVLPAALELGTSLIHMYAKCGRLDAGMRFFEGMESPDAPTWTAAIGGLAMHGRGEEAVALFERMAGEGVTPDGVTFTSVLHACSHCGMLETGVRVFSSMKKMYGVEARMEHYGALVDLLGRAGRLEAAERVVGSMPFEPNRVVWGSLLHGCLMNGDRRVGERLERRLLGLGLGGGGMYVGVSNGYAGVGRWEEVGRIREWMVERGVRKEKGYSLVEVNGIVHKFLVGDTINLLTMEMHRLLCGIIRENDDCMNFYLNH